MKTRIRLALFCVVALSMVSGCRSNRPPSYSYPDYSSRYTRQAREYEQSREKALREEDSRLQKEEQARLEQEKKAEKEQKKAEEKRLAAAQRAARGQEARMAEDPQDVFVPPARSPVRPPARPSGSSAPVVQRPVSTAPRATVVVPPPAVEESVSRQEGRAASGSSPYQLKSGDMLAIYLRGIPREEEIQCFIDENGYVTLTYINEVPAAGKTTSELERTIREAYLQAEIYKNISVNVVMQQQSYFVRGEVRNPGRFTLLSGTTLMQAIATAGGYTEYAQPKKVRLLRGGKSTLHDLKKIERNPEKDLSIEAEDVIVIPRSVF